MALKETFYKVLYALLFNMILPILLIIWATGSSSNIPLPVLNSSAFGITLTVFGVVIVLTGMLNLLVWGKGLPMNAFPPKYFVTRGLYKFISHPIYAGAIITTIGISILFNSSGGFWLVTPVFTLCCFALIYGYEKENILKHFGIVEANYLINIPEDSEDKAGLWNYLSVYILVFLFWFVLYELVCLAGTNERSISTFMKFENSVPVIEWTEIFYFLTYPFVMIVPLVFKTKKQLREFSITGMTAVFVGIFLQIIFPFIAPPKAFESSGMLGKLIEFERQLDSAAAAFPSFHVIWAFVAAYYYSIRFEKKFFWYLIAFIISISCVTTGMHSIVDVAAGYITFLIIINMKGITNLMFTISEKIANSWHEWDFGNFRILNHGFYVGIGGTAGYLIITTFSGQSYYAAAFYVALFVIVFAGLWAQIVEGSNKLSRPYGFYGGVLGAAAGILITGWLSGLQTGLLLGSYAIAAPWIQISGRFRCLIQGCCHGKETNTHYGIKFYHPRSRVTRLSNLGNKLLHPTQLYSIISNFLIGIFLLRLWYENTSPEFIAGIYLILNGLSRFAEEAYRGEPQTPIFGGLRLYQWLAILSILAGAWMTTITSNIIWPPLHINSMQILLSIIIGMVTFFAMGVDFPKSNKRFARLA